jgi:Ca2+-binding EF-hand superfamily protein
MKTQTLSLLGLIALMLPSAIPAQTLNGAGPKADRGASPEAILARFDTDQNGSLSADEVRGRMAKRFAAIDANGDESIDLEELGTAREQSRQRMEEKAGKVKDADTDGNRSISIDEAAAAGMDKLVKHFSAVDTDGDGELSRAEMRAFRKANKNRKGAPE